jgi:hypothetical protein
MVAGAVGVAFSALTVNAMAGVTIVDPAGAAGHARFVGNSFGFASSGSTSPTPPNTQANVNIGGSGGSGSTGGGLGNAAGTASFGSALTTVTVSANATEFRVHISGVGDLTPPAGYVGLQISSSLGFFETALSITGSGAMPYTITKTGDMANGSLNVNWTLVPDTGSTGVITPTTATTGTLTAGRYLFDEGGSAPEVTVTYNFGNGPAATQHRTFSGDFVITIGGGGASGVCCRGATCNTSVTQAACLPSNEAGAVFVSTSTVCNAAANPQAPCCYANYNKTGGIAVNDIFAYLNDWFAGRPAAVMGGNGVSGQPTVANIFDFLNAWFAGGC